MDRLVNADIFLTTEDQEVVKEYMRLKDYSFETALSILVGFGIETAKRILEENNK